jgi:hypothetical protein
VDVALDAVVGVGTDVTIGDGPAAPVAGIGHSSVTGAGDRATGTPVSDRETATASPVAMITTARRTAHWERAARRRATRR